MRLISFLLAIAVCLAVVTDVSAQGRPTVYGKILVEAGPRLVPLRGVTVHLLSFENGEYEALTDSFGNFAFYNVRPGRYEVQVTYGRKVVSGSTVDVNGKGTRIPDIVVRRF